MERFRQKQSSIYAKPAPEDVAQKVREGRMFIPVGDDFSDGMVPDQYVLTRVRYRDSRFNVIVPKQLFFYMANPGEGGDIDLALDEISELYGEIKHFEKGLIQNGDTNVQEADWSVLARESYATYLINKLTRDGENFRPEIEKKFGGDYVQKRMKSMAALALEKSMEEIEKQNIADVLVHKTEIKSEITETHKEKYQVECWAGSHYELRDAYRTVRSKVTHFTESGFVDKEIRELEDDILKQLKDKSPHDRALLRQYVNLAYITKENPAAQLDVSPPNNGAEKPEDSKKSVNARKDEHLL